MSGHIVLRLGREAVAEDLIDDTTTPARPRHAPAIATTEENFQAGKQLTGLDEHQVRRWDSWYRWTTLAMLARAFLSITAAAEHTRPPPEDQIPLTRNEIAALFSTRPGLPLPAAGR
jgi:SRSO17 transposase